jgi:RNA polymerase sigma-70 factor (ECF subfamily)
MGTNMKRKRKLQPGATARRIRSKVQSPAIKEKGGEQCAKPAPARDDMALVYATKSGDVAAFGELVKRYDRKLFRVAQLLTHNPEDAQDAVQDAFMKAFQKLGQFQGNSKFSTWLFRINVNESRMKMRKQRSRRKLPIVEDFRAEANNLPVEVADWTPNPEELYRASELQAILIKTSQQLRPGLRVVFLLRDVEGLSTDQTAAVLDLNHSAVKSRLRRARMQLREQLSKYFGRRGPLAPVDPKPEAECLCRTA